MQTKFRRYLYYQIKDNIECYNQRAHKVKHIFVMIAFSILVVRCFLGIYSHVNGNSQYLNYDPFIYFLYATFDKVFVHYAIITIISFLLGTFGTYNIGFHRLHQIYYELIVLNLDQIKICSINSNQQATVIDQNYRDYFKNFNQFVFWQLPAIQLLVKKSFKQFIKNKLQFSAELIDKNKLSKCKLNSIPNASIEFRLKMGRIVDSLEHHFYTTHLYISKYILFPLISLK